MRTSSIIQRAFAAGELSPSLVMRADLAKYQTGLRTCRNFIVQRFGGVANRPGFRFIGPCADDGANKMLLPYVSEEPGESVLIEAGVGYLRFWLNGAAVELAGVTAWNGATDYVIGDIVEAGGVNYYAVAPSTNEQPPNGAYWYAMPGSLLEIPTPFASFPLFQWHQSGRVITMTHVDVPPHELIYVGITQWVFRRIDTSMQVAAPENLVLTAGGGGSRTMGYVVTAVHPETFEESEASAQVVDAACADPTEQAPNVVKWDAVTTAGVTSPEYYVYCDPYGNGTYGYIGTATGVAEFRDPGILPDFSRTPPQKQDPFADPLDYPGTSATFQQRRFFARTKRVPDGVWASRIGLASNFAISSPLQDNDALTFRVAGNDNHPVHWLIDLRQLLLGTGGGFWSVGDPSTRSALTPSNIPATQETFAGISPYVPPCVVGNTVLYVQSRQRIVRALRFEEQVLGLAGEDLTIFAGHLFDEYQLRSLAFQETPNSIVWLVRNDGTLVALTYLPEQDVAGWHRHDTDGFFEFLCVVPEAGEDALYAIVRRTIGGVTKRYIERLESRVVANWSEDVFFVDSGLSYSGPPIAVVGGLSHLEGKTVAAVGDGRYLGTFEVSGGVVNLGQTASVIHIGLPYTADIETLDLDVNGTDIRDKRKIVQSVTMLIDESSRAFKVGPSEPHLVSYQIDPKDGSAVRFSGPVELGIRAAWNTTGRILVRQDVPLPLTILGLVPRVGVGG